MAQRMDVLVIGQGICGTFLSMELERAGLSHLVIDEWRPDTASRAAAGVINPVTGRRLVTTWMIGELLDLALETYQRMSGLLGSTFLEATSVVDFFPTVQMRLAFIRRLEEGGQYLELPENEHAWDGFFRYDLGYGVVRPCFVVDVPGLLRAWRQRLLDRGILREERFELRELVVEGGSGRPGGEVGDRAGVRYRDIEAGRVIFCDGIAALDNPYFSRLPFAPNKGEALILEVDDLPAGATIFKKGITLAPWGEGRYWVGSSYEWSFADAAPTAAFRARTEAVLNEWLRVPFRTVEHLASVRPATVERRPFVGFHPQAPSVGMLNGMGTKGCSLAPYFARQLVDHLVTGKAIQADADLRRFSKVLGRAGSG
jgi:glycine/D-amino acid oxidase-like deaminating enzyme